MKKSILILALFVSVSCFGQDRYKLLSVNVHPEIVLSDSTFSNIITLNIFPNDSIVPPFSKDINVISFMRMSGFEIGMQRDSAVVNYMRKLNK